MTYSPPLRRPGRPRREESDDIQHQLVEAATQMLLEHGPSLTMNRIIAASGLSRKTVYAHYPNKTALFEAVVRQMLTHAVTPMTVPAAETWQESLLAFVEACLIEVCDKHAMVMRRLLTSYPAFLEEAQPRIEQAVVRRYFDPLTEFLQSLVDDNVLPDQDTAFAAEALTTLLFSESQRRFYQDQASERIDMGRLNHHARRLAGLFCGGIMTPGA